MCLYIKFLNDHESSFEIWLDVFKEIKQVTVVNSIAAYRAALSRTDAVLMKRQFAHENFGGRVSSREAQILSTFWCKQDFRYSWVVAAPTIPWEMHRLPGIPVKYTYSYDENHTRRDKYRLKFDQIFALVNSFNQANRLKKIEMIAQDFITTNTFDDLSRSSNIERLVVDLDDISSTPDHPLEKAEGIKDSYVKHYPSV